MKQRVAKKGAAQQGLNGALRTAAEVRAEFLKKGISLSEWAALHGVSRVLTWEILAGSKRRACKRGQSHRIAVLLGLKAGEVGATPASLNAVQLPPNV